MPKKSKDKYFNFVEFFWDVSHHLNKKKVYYFTIGLVIINNIIFNYFYKNSIVFLTLFSITMAPNLFFFFYILNDKRHGEKRKEIFGDKEWKENYVTRFGYDAWHQTNFFSHYDNNNPKKPK